MAVFKPGQSSDDCYDDGTDTTRNDTLVFGDVAGLVFFESGIRFINVTIAKGATILTAKVTFQESTGTAGTTCNVQIKGENVDDAATFSNHANYAGRARTSESVNWNSIPGWEVDTDYDSPSITTIVQAIINRAGWVSGNDLVLFFANNSSSADAYRMPKAYDTSTTLCPRLTITYSEVTGPTMPIVMSHYMRLRINSS